MCKFPNDAETCGHWVYCSAWHGNGDKHGKEAVPTFTARNVESGGIRQVFGENRKRACLKPPSLQDNRGYRLSPPHSSTERFFLKCIHSHRQNEIVDSLSVGIVYLPPSFFRCHSNTCFYNHVTNGITIRPLQSSRSPFRLMEDGT